jgi:hypothetical protein
MVFAMWLVMVFVMVFVTRGVRVSTPGPVGVRRLLVAGSLAMSLVLSPAVVHASDIEDFDRGDRVFDAMVLRPLGAIGTVVGFGFFVCSIPLAGVTQQLDLAWDAFVVKPSSYTFERTLGDF